MKGIMVRFFMYEFEKHKGMLLYEWLLEFAKKNKIEGGSVFRAIAGYGKHGIVHEEKFFELASNVPVEVVFIVKKDECDHFFGRLKNEGINLVYAISEVEYGMINQKLGV